MQIVESRSTVKFPAMLVGPTVTLINRDIHQEEREMEDGSKITEWVATLYRLEDGEYDLVRAGILPDGATWDAELRRIERSALLDSADMNIAEAQDYIQAGESGWEAYLTAMRQYKMDVRATTEQAGFPLSVTYPSVPEKP